MTDPDWTSIVDTLNGVVQTLLIIFGFLFTFRQLRVWRDEYLGSKKIEHMIQLGQSVVGFEAAFLKARFPFETKTKDEDEQQVNQRLLDESYRSQKNQIYWYKKLAIVDEAYNRVRQECLMCQLYNISEAEVILKQCQEMRTKFANAIVGVVFEPSSQEKHFYTLFATLSSEDEFGNEISQLTQNTLAIVRRYTK